MPSDARKHSIGEIVLETRGLTKIFGGLTAVNAVDLKVHKGEILSLIGPNGAGKTTVFNVVSGIYKPEQGQVLFGGQDITGRKPHKVVECGIARTFQNIRLFPDMTCLENVMAGRHCRSRSDLFASVFKTPRQRAEEQSIRAVAERRLEQVNLAGLRDELAKNIAYGSQRMLEIARALAAEPDLLVLDEPSSGLNPRETEDLMVFLKSLIREDDVTILLIEHDMNLVMGISDWVVVLDGGRKIAEGVPEDVYADPQVIEAYLGKEDEDMGYGVSA